MEIRATIKETLAQLIEQMKNSDNWSYRKGEVPNRFYLDDKEYNASAVVEIRKDSLKIVTAWSGFTYIFQNMENGNVKLNYYGAMLGYKQQFLMPSFSSNNDERCYSSEVNGEYTLQEVAREKSYLLVKKQVKGIEMEYPQINSTFKIGGFVPNKIQLQDGRSIYVPNSTKVCDMNISIKGYPFPTKELTWLEIIDIAK